MSFDNLSFKMYKYYAIKRENGVDELVQGFNDYNECKFYCENNNLIMIDYSNRVINFRELK